jgi:NTE family protein
MDIALALSGGGFRATIFHLGVLARLAAQNRLEEVTFLSTVSGGSLCAGLVFSLNELQWPTSDEYTQKIVPEARRLLTTFDLQRALIFRLLGTFWTLLETKADDLSALLQRHWGITASLKDLPPNPRWMINATCYETGKNWRFERFWMGDYVFGYTNDTDLPLADAVAASAGFPGLIGPLVIDTTTRSWFRYKDRPQDELPSESSARTDSPKTRPVQPAFPEVHLWDGGVYDNHGLEGLHNFVEGWREGVQFLIVSDAAGRSRPEPYRPGPKALLRIATGIMMDQIRSLRSRAILERLINHRDVDKGVFLQTGNKCREVLEQAGLGGEIQEKCSDSLSDHEAEMAAEMPTVIRRLKEDEFERLFRHGYEVADATLYSYYPREFEYLGYARSR